MASKFGLPGGIPERRVRPIWDAVDSRQFKIALKHSASLLAKYPNSPYALALKALILERMGKNEDALSVSLNAKEILCKGDSKVWIDELTLSTLQIVFQRLDHLDMATNCYEYACGKFPNNLELMMGLFNCYVREYSFVKQQQIAIKLYKIAGEERFLLWAICSIQLQVCCGNGGEKLLQLAEGLLKKHIASHSLHEPEALCVYLSLLEQQTKYGDALEVLSGELGSLMMIEVDKLRLQGKLLARAGDYAAASDVFRKVLQLCPDDWECFLQYLGCLLEDQTIFIGGPDQYESPNLRIPEELFDSRMLEANNFIGKLIVEADSNPIRCPYLAQLEIERRKLLSGRGDADKVVELLIHYFIRLGHLACFSTDVEMFFEVLDNRKKSEFLKKLMKECEGSTDVPTKALGHSITVFKIQNLIGDVFALPENDLGDLAVRMIELFCKNLPLSKELDVQESMYGEELLSMACDVLVQLFWRSRDLGYLLVAVIILEFGLALRRHVSQYKILLVHLYSYWNCLPLAYECYKSLEVKNILLETVAHHILPQMLASPLWADLDYLLGDYLKFMDDHLQESADLTFLAYRHRNYSKVIEFVQFKDKLQRSSQYLLAKIEAPILQLKKNSVNLDEEESIWGSLKHGTHFIELFNEIRSKSLTFNEDMKLRPWWTPSYDKNYLLGPFEGLPYSLRGDMRNQTKLTQENVLKTIEKRSIIPRMIYLSVNSASASVKETVEANGSTFDPKLSQELKMLLEQYAKLSESSFQDMIELLAETSTGEKFFVAPHLDIIDLMNFAVFLNAWSLSSDEDVFSGKGTSTWSLVNSLMNKCVTEKIASVGHIASSPGNSLPFLVQMITEPVAWHCLIIQSCARSLPPLGKKKKKATGQIENSNSQLSRELQNSIQSLCDTIEVVVKWSKEQIEKPFDEKFESIFSSVRRSDGPGKVFKALESSISLMNDVELGHRMSEALQSWNPVDVTRKIVTGQGSLLLEFVKICESKAKSLRALKVLS